MEKIEDAVRVIRLAKERLFGESLDWYDSLPQKEGKWNERKRPGSVRDSELEN